MEKFKYSDTCLNKQKYMFAGVFTCNVQEQVYTKSPLLLLQGSLWAILQSTSATINQSLWRSSGTIMYNAGLNREHSSSITNIDSHFFLDLAV